MNRKPIIWRLVFVIIVLICFIWSMHPLRPKDFYKTFRSLIGKESDKIARLIELAEEKQQKDKSIYSSEALQRAADELNIDLTEYVKGKGFVTNRDVISEVRKRAASSIRLGIDLNGGVEFLLRLKPDKEKAGKGADNFDRNRDIAIEILRNRLEEEKIFESEISPAGKEFISLKVPVVSKDEKLRLLNLVKRAAKLKFHLVAKNNESLKGDYLKNPEKFVAPVGYEKKIFIRREKGKKPQKEIYFINSKPEMDGTNVEDAYPTLDQFGQRQIALRFNSKGAREFGRVTGNNVDRLLAVVLDGKLYSAPKISGPIPTGNAVITGTFSSDEAKNIANALKSGSLPVKVEVDAISDISPTLGAEAVENGLYAGIIAMITVMLFMLIYYLRAGIVANVALFVNIIMVLGALAAFEATLTLPGIAGIILTIGMAVDANVLIFERIREELMKDKTLLSAIDTGYSRAFTAIFDANITTLFTALILWSVGTGPVKGFGVTLSIGIATSMFTAIFLTRLVFDVMARIYSFRTMKMLSFFSEPKVNFLGLRYIAFTVSGILFAGSIVLAVFHGQDIFGIDFTGGTQITLSYDKKIPQHQLEATLAKAGYGGAKLAYKTSMAVKDNKKLEIVIRDRDISVGGTEKQATSPKIEITELLNKKYPGANFRGGHETSLGGLIGWEFSKAAITALFLAVIGIVIYISIRFEFAYAMAAIIAIIHDVIIATGIFILMGRELSLPVVAALLTIIGYSLNDTIVVFDRIREDLGLVKNRSYKEIINLSINQTLSRTILTSLTTLLVLFVLFFMGGIAINDFVFVMLVGVIVGTYSSIFVASPIVAVWHKTIGKNIK